MLTDVSRETLHRLEEMLITWNAHINLVARTTDDLWDRHIRDSLRLAHHAPTGNLHWLDAGSGGGFPGLVVAIARPDVEMTLVESDRRKSAFLRAAVRELDLGSVSVASVRVEMLKPCKADILSARALAPLKSLFALMNRHAKAGTTYLLPKGTSFMAEIQDAKASWTFDYKVHPSDRDDRGPILEISDVQPREVLA